MSAVPDTDITAALHEAKRAIEASGQARATIEAAIVGVKADLAAVKAAQDAAALDAAGRPIGTDAELVRCYVGADPGSRVLDISSARGARVGQDGTTHLGRQGSQAVRLLTETDEFGDVHPGLLDDPAPKTEWQAELQREVALRSLGELCRARGGMPRTSRKIDRLLKRGPQAISRMFADNSGEGSQFMPTAVSAMLDRYAALPRVVASLFEVAPIGSVDVVNPFVSAGAVPQLIGQPVSGDMNPAVIPSVTPTTADRTMTASTLAVNIIANLDAAEDSIVAFGPWALSEIAIALADGYEDALINGDSTATHEDTIASWTGGSRWPSTGMGTAADHRRAFKGLRRKAVDSAATSDRSGSDTVVGAIGMRTLLTGAHRAGELVYIANLANLIAKLLTDSNFLTVDKAGSLASMLTGQIGMIGGYPVVISEFLTEDLNASGLFDNVTTTYTGLLIVNKAQWKVVRRRGPSTEISRAAWLHSQYVTGSMRQGFFDVQSVSSTLKTVAYGYKMAKS